MAVENDSAAVFVAAAVVAPPPKRRGLSTENSALSLFSTEVFKIYADAVKYIYSRIRGIALTGYVVPGCVEDGAWMLWENSSAVAAVAVARSFSDKFSKHSLFLVIYINKKCFLGGTCIFKNVVFQFQFPPKARLPVV